MKNLLQGLNEEQRQAVTTTEGFVRVIAGAGSGKTRALARRFAYLVNDIGIMPGHILCVTFTNKSANEMRERIHRLTGDNDTGYINTFHGFCVSVLQEDSYAVSYPKSFLVLDNSDIDDMLDIIYAEMGLTLRDMPFSRARDMIEMKKIVWKPDYYKDMIRMDLDTLREKYHHATNINDIIFYGYLYQEKKCFGLDYNDLIKFTLYIFQTNEEIRLKWQKRLEYIMIDEFQDIDKLQYQLMKVLCGYHKNLFIVGDPDQCIYTWRGASVRYLLDFDRDFPGTKTIFMMKNYRSTPEILHAVNSLISKNVNRMEKDLIPTRPSGVPVLAHLGGSPEEEAKWIVREIQKIHRSGAEYRDIAILYRAHYITRNLEKALLDKKIPYMIYSGVQFYDRAEIKDALSYLRMICYKDDLSFRRIVNNPKRNIGKRRMDFLSRYSQEHGCSLYEALRQNAETPLFTQTKAQDFISLIERFSKDTSQRPVSEVLSAILDESGYEKRLRTEGSQERLDNLAELKQSVFEYETTCGEETNLVHYLEHAALFTNIDREKESDRVRLMTVHTAKGLEFPYVFLCAMNEGIFPSTKTKTIQSMEEERRLAFVAMTRARDALILSCAGGENYRGAIRYPSRFLLDIDPKYLHFDKKPSDSLLTGAREFINTAAAYLKEEKKEVLLEEGTRVHHPVFGNGTIQKTDKEKQSYLIQFDTMKTPRAISFRAKLKSLQ